MEQECTTSSNLARRPPAPFIPVHRWLEPRAQVSMAANGGSCEWNDNPSVPAVDTTPPFRCPDAHYLRETSHFAEPADGRVPPRSLHAAFRWPGNDTVTVIWPRRMPQRPIQAGGVRSTAPTPLVSWANSLWSACC